MIINKLHKKILFMIFIFCFTLIVPVSVLADNWSYGTPGTYFECGIDPVSGAVQVAVVKSPGAYSSPQYIKVYESDTNRLIYSTQVAAQDFFSGTYTSTNTLSVGHYAILKWNVNSPILETDYSPVYGQLLPSPPTGVAVSGSSNQCTLTWDNNAAIDNVTSYNIYENGSKIGTSTGTTYSLSELTPGSYQFTVSAVNAIGEGQQSSPISYTTVLNVPGQVTATPGNAQVTLSWNGVAGATGYNIGRATTSGGIYTTIASNVSDTIYTDTNLTNGTTYYYVVSATSASGGSDNSAEVSGTPQTSEIGSPSNLLTTSADGQVSLTWTGVSGATSYNVKRSTTSGGIYATIATGLTSSNYTDTSVINGTTYYYVVTAVSESGESGNSNEATATPQSSASSSPTNLVATASSDQIGLTWTAATGATGYNVKRSATAGGPYISIAQNVPSPNYTDASVTAGATYYYVVIAITSEGESANSNEASAIVPTSAPADGRLYVLLDINEQAQLSVSDNLSDNATLTWTSSDPTLATVDANGEVTAIKEGECKITATNSDGTFTDYIPVKVMKGAENFRLALNLKAGESKRLWISDDSSSVTWTTMDPGVASIDSTGKVTAAANGLCIVQGEFNGKAYYIYVRVN